jgi:ATP-dependent DNA helicase DinG
VLADALHAVEGLSPDLGRLAERARSVQTLCERFGAAPRQGQVRWIDVSPHGARLVESPLDIRDMLSEQRRQQSRAWVFTSATLGDDDRLSWFTRGTALEDATVLRVESPFDYARQARQWVPRAFPKPGEASHPQAVGRLAARCALALGGRCFVLTTTLRVLPLIAEALRLALSEEHADYDVIVQGSGPRRTLMQRFADGRARVLVGSQSFWEGIDVPGDALQCVIIDKLPFPPPNDPLVEARVKLIESQGGDPFREHFLAEAAIALKQGGGRLIRTETDRGLLVVCDPRLVQMSYGARLRSALPPMQTVQQEQDAIAWLQSLAADH